MGLPREFDVALVAEDGNASRSSPSCGHLEVDEFTARVGRCVDPQAECPLGVGVGDLVEGGVRHRPAAGQRGTHRVRRVTHRRVQHCVAFGGAQVQPLRHARNELLGADARRDLGAGLDGDADAPCEPPRRRLTKGERADRRWIPSLGVTRGQRSDDGRGRRVARCADREIDTTSRQFRGHRRELVESVVRIRRGDEARHRST